MKNLGQAMVRFLPPSPVNLVARLPRNVIDEGAQLTDALLPVLRQVEAVHFAEAHQPQVLIERAMADASDSANLPRVEQIKLAALPGPELEYQHSLPDGALLRARNLCNLLFQSFLLYLEFIEALDFPLVSHYSNLQCGGLMDICLSAIKFFEVFTLCLCLRER